MKLTYLAGAMALVLGVATTASAQGTPHEGAPAPRGRMGPGGAERRAQMDAILFKGLTLTKAQKASFEKLNAAQETEMKALFDSLKGKRPDEADRKKMRALREKQAAEFRALLTKEQQPIYDKNVADLKAIMKEHMRKRDGGPPTPPPAQ